MGMQNKCPVSMEPAGRVTAKATLHHHVVHEGRSVQRHLKVAGSEPLFSLVNLGVRWSVVYRSGVPPARGRVAFHNRQTRHAASGLTGTGRQRSGEAIQTTLGFVLWFRSISDQRGWLHMFDSDDFEQHKPEHLRRPSVLYHYTTPTAFQSIVEKQELWASDWRFLNDRLELQLGRDMLDTEMKKIESSFQVGVIDALYELRDSLFDGRKFKDIAYCLFVNSFCSKPDLLSQWRSYGRGRGIAIGFHRSFLEGAGHGHAFGLRQVVYKEKDQMELIRMVLGSIPMLVTSTEKHAVKAQVEDFWLTMIPALLSIKHQSFEEESEWRLIAFLPTIRQAIRFRSTENSIVPYYPIPLTRSDRHRHFSRHSHAFAEAMLGPGWHPESKASVEMILARNNVEVPVSITETPYIP